jgi:hypothetical protein
VLIEQAKADVEARTLEHRFTPLHYAACRGHRKVVRTASSCDVRRAYGGSCFGICATSSSILSLRTIGCAATGVRASVGTTQPRASLRRRRSVNARRRSPPRTGIEIEIGRFFCGT